MHFFPFVRSTFVTTLNLKEITEQLELNIEPEKMIHIGLLKNEYSKPYVGYLTSNRFAIKQFEQISFILPRLEGTIHENKTESKIIIKMKLGFRLKLFLSFFFGGLTLAVIIMLGISFNQGSFVIQTLIPIGMFIIAYLPIYLDFNRACDYIINDLKKIFKARIIKKNVC